MMIHAINKQGIALLMLLTLLSQQSLAAMVPLFVIDQSGERHGLVAHAACQEHHSHHSACDDGQASDSVSHDHSAHQNHCEFCISGCYSLPTLNSRLITVGTALALPSLDDLSFIPKAPISHLFRPPINA